MSPNIVCQHCKHYFITWENDNPHGCKAYGFKSKIICSVMVKQSSDIDCNLFCKKETKDTTSSQDTQLKI